MAPAPPCPGVRWSPGSRGLPCPGVLARIRATEPLPGAAQPSRPIPIKMFPGRRGLFLAPASPIPSPPPAHILLPKFCFFILPLNPLGEEKRNPRSPLAGRGPNPGFWGRDRSPRGLLPRGSGKGGGDGAETPGDGDRDSDSDRMGALVAQRVPACGRCREAGTPPEPPLPVRCSAPGASGGRGVSASSGSAGPGCPCLAEGWGERIHERPTKAPPFPPLRRVSVTPQATNSSLPWGSRNGPGLALSCQARCAHFSILAPPRLAILTSPSPAQCPHLSIPSPALSHSAFPSPHSHIPTSPLSPSPRPQARRLLQGHSGVCVRGESPAWSFTCAPALLPVYIHAVFGIFSIWILAAARPRSGCECKCLWLSQPPQPVAVARSPRRTPWPWVPC